MGCASAAVSVQRVRHGWSDRAAAESRRARCCPCAVIVRALNIRLLLGAVMSPRSDRSFLVRSLDANPGLKSAYIAVGILTLAACGEVSTSVRERPLVSLAYAADTVPSRGSETVGSPLRYWGRVSHSELWNEAATRDTMFAIGIKAPSERRGVWQGRWRITPAEFTTSISLLSQTVGVAIVVVDTLLPWATAKVSDVEALARVRALPFVDYVEPMHLRSAPFDLGCDDNLYTGPTLTTPSGDVMSHTFDILGIPRAWAYATGEGVWIGITDTGLSNVSLEYGTNFASGQSTGRSLLQSSTSNNAMGCSHGTRMAGVVAAPMNGRHVVGIAYKANLHTVFHGNHVWPNVWGENQAEAIRRAAEGQNGQGRSTVISLGWGSSDWSDQISDEIDRWYARPPPGDVLFVGAAGSSPAGLYQGSVKFPANKSNVLAVTAVDWNGERDNQSHRGPELDLVAYHNVPTTAFNYYVSEPVDLQHSSAASAVVTGIAALVRSRYPLMLNVDVMNRLKATSGLACGMPSALEQKLVNAVAAVGGLCVPHISGSNAVGVTASQPSATTTYSVSPSGGDGPYEYRWSNGSTGPTATYTFWVSPDYSDRYTEIWVTVKDLGRQPAAGHELRTKKVFINYYQESPDDPCAPGDECPV